MLIGVSKEKKEKVAEIRLKLQEINKLSARMILDNNILQLLSDLEDDEEILYYANCKFRRLIRGKKKDTIKLIQSYIYITNKKIIIKENTLMPTANTKTIQYEKISSLDSGSSFLGSSWITITFLGDEFEIQKLTPRDLENIKQKINEGINSHKNVSINITKTTEKDVADKIARLKVLYDEGVLTEFEFNMKKLELLDKSK